MLKKGLPLKFLKPLENRLKIDEHRPSLYGNGSSPSRNSKTQNLQPMMVCKEKKQNILNDSIERIQGISPKARNSLKNRLSFSESKDKQRKSSEIKFIQYKNKINSSKKIKLKLDQPLKINEVPFTESEDILNEEEMIKIKEHVEQIFSQMIKHHCIMFSGLFIKMKKEKLMCFMQTLFNTLVDVRPCKTVCQRSPLSSIFEKIKEEFDSFALKKKSQKMRLSSRNTVTTIDPQYFRGECENIQKDIQQLILQKKNSSQQTEKVKQTCNYFQERCENLKETLCQLEKNVYNLKEQQSSAISNIQEMNRKQEILKNSLIDLDQKEKEILNFVDNQTTRPIMLQVSEDFKRIEGEIFDYAYYVESCANLHSKTWQPYPFKLMEQYIQEDLKHVIWDIEQEQFSLETKQEKMKQFVQTALRKYKRKDQELVKIVEEKTDAIRDFVERMRTWVENYEIKRDLLGRLRKEFARDSQNISELLQKLKKSTIDNEQYLWLKDLKKYWELVIENYKFGNSFF